MPPCSTNTHLCLCFYSPNRQYKGGSWSHNKHGRSAFEQWIDNVLFSGETRILTPLVPIGRELLVWWVPKQDWGKIRTSARSYISGSYKSDLTNQDISRILHLQPTATADASEKIATTPGKEANGSCVAASAFFKQNQELSWRKSWLQKMQCVLTVYHL